jgi:hypothetical protein
VTWFNDDNVLCVLHRHNGIAYSASSLKQQSAGRHIATLAIVFLSINLFSISAGNRIGGVMISVLDSNAVDRRLEPQSGKTKDYELGI